MATQVKVSPPSFQLQFQFPNRDYQQPIKVIRKCPDGCFKLFLYGNSFDTITVPELVKVFTSKQSALNYSHVYGIEIQF